MKILIYIILVFLNVTTIISQNLKVVFPFDIKDYNSKFISLIQTNGKVITAGTFGGKYGFDSLIISRFHRNGTPDYSFNQNVKIKIGKGAVELREAILTTNGDIIGIGSSFDEDELLLVKFDSLGKLDENFGYNGISKTICTNQRGAFGISFDIDSNGNIVVTGWCDGVKSLLVARFKSNGIIDSTFGNNGLLVVDSELNTISFEGVSIKCLNNGQIVVLGKSFIGDELSEDFKSGYFVVRLNNKGDINKNYGVNGLLEIKTNNFVINASTKEVLYSYLLDCKIAFNE